MKIQKMFNNKVNLYKGGLNEFIIKYAGFNKKVLDVGCSEGKLGKYLKRYKNATVFGIDISDRAIKKAKKNLDGAYLLNIETNNLPFPRKSFDVIICADVLEHLFNPLLVLKKLKPYLKDNGIFILSIPNVANIKVRWNLLRGRFDYQKYGIMDDSHIHFFTKKTVCRLIDNAGMKIIKMDYSPGFSFFFFQGRIMKYKILKNLHDILTRTIPPLFCAQFIVVAKP